MATSRAVVPKFQITEDRSRPDRHVIAANDGGATATNLDWFTDGERNGLSVQPFSEWPSSLRPGEEAWLSVYTEGSSDDREVHLVVTCDELGETRYRLWPPLSVGR